MQQQQQQHVMMDEQEDEKQVLMWTKAERGHKNREQSVAVMPQSDYRFTTELLLNCWD